jgi:hypothetical protein
VGTKGIHPNTCEKEGLQKEEGIAGLKTRTLGGKVPLGIIIITSP